MMGRTLWAAVLVAALAGCGGSGGTGGQQAGSTVDEHAGHDHAQGTAPAADAAIAIEVTEDGFVPAEVTVNKGEPVTLVVTRKTEKTCATEFIMKSQGINQKLPMNEAVTISFTPTESGELRYACGMDMIAGKVIVK